MHAWAKWPFENSRINHFWRDWWVDMIRFQSRFLSKSPWNPSTVRPVGLRCQGRRPLHWAACLSHCSVAELLLSKGAMLDAVDAQGLGPGISWFVRKYLIPQQCKLMGSSAQNSFGVHWCRRRVRFNQVPEKVPKVPEKVWEALVQSQVRFNSSEEGSGEGLGGFGAEPGQVQQGSEEGSGEGLGGFGARSGSTGFRRRFRRRSRRLWCRARSGSTGLRRRFRRKVQQGSGEGSGKGSRKPWCKVKSGSTGSGEGSGEGLGGFGAEPGHVQQGSGEGSGEGLGGFGAEPGHVQQGSGEGSGEGLGGFGAEPGQVQQGSGEGFGEGSWCKAKSGSTGSGEGCREGPGAGPGQVPTGSTGFPALGFSACFRKICKNKRCGCLLGIPPKLIFLFFSQCWAKNLEINSLRGIPSKKCIRQLFWDTALRPKVLGPRPNRRRLGGWFHGQTAQDSCSHQLLRTAPRAPGFWSMSRRNIPCWSLLIDQIIGRCTSWLSGNHYIWIYIWWIITHNRNRQNTYEPTTVVGLGRCTVSWL